MFREGEAANERLQSEEVERRLGVGTGDISVRTSQLHPLYQHRPQAAPPLAHIRIYPLRKCFESPILGLHMCPWKGLQHIKGAEVCASHNYLAAACGVGWIYFGLHLSGKCFRSSGQPYTREPMESVSHQSEIIIVHIHHHIQHFNLDFHTEDVYIAAKLPAPQNRTRITELFRCCWSNRIQLTAIADDMWEILNR